MTEKMFKEKTMQLLEDIKFSELCAEYKYWPSGIHLDEESKTVGLFFQTMIPTNVVKTPFYTFQIDDNKNDIILGIRMVLSGTDDGFGNYGLPLVPKNPSI